jgi:hypothetical protein
MDCCCCCCCCRDHESQFPASFMGLITVMGQRKVADILLNLEVEGRKQKTVQGSCRRRLWSHRQCTRDVVVVRHHIKSWRNLPAVGCRYLLHGCKCDPQATSSSFIEELQYLLINVHLTANSSWSLATYACPANPYEILCSSTCT